MVAYTATTVRESILKFFGFLGRRYTGDDGSTARVLSVNVENVGEFPTGGSGGGGAVTIADGADVTQGSKSDAAPANPAAPGTISGRLSGIWAALLAATPAGTNAIGTTGTTGTTGLDYSANKPTIPVVGANFGTTGTYANFVLIATAPASVTRNKVDIENLSGAQIVVVRDDGTAAGGAAPNNASIFSLVGGSGSGVEGAAWASTTFKGRLQIYAASSTAFVAVMVD